MGQNVFFVFCDFDVSLPKQIFFFLPFLDVKTGNRMTALKSATTLGLFQDCQFLEMNNAARNNDSRIGLLIVSRD